MLRVHLFALLAKTLTILLCWLVLMGIPAMLFRPPLSAGDWKLFLGVFYAILLATGVLVGRSWGGRGVVWVALPFVILFTGVVLHTLADSAMSPLDKGMTALNFGAIYLVSWLAWRLAKRLRPTEI